MVCFTPNATKYNDKIILMFTLKMEISKCWCTISLKRCKLCYYDVACIIKWAEIKVWGIFWDNNPFTVQVSGSGFFFTLWEWPISLKTVIKLNSARKFKTSSIHLNIWILINHGGCTCRKHGKL